MSRISVVLNTNYYKYIAFTGTSELKISASQDLNNTIVVVEIYNDTEMHS